MGTDKKYKADDVLRITMTSVSAKHLRERVTIRILRDGKEKTYYRTLPLPTAIKRKRKIFELRAGDKLLSITTPPKFAPSNARLSMGSV